MEDGDNKASQPAADKSEEGSTEVHTEVTLSEDEIAATIDSVVDAFFAARGEEGDGRVADESMKKGEAAVKVVAEGEAGDNGGEEHTAAVDQPVEEEIEEEIDEEIEDGGDGAQAVAAIKLMPNQTSPVKEVGGVGMEVGDGGDEFTPAQSPRNADDSEMQKNSGDGDAAETGEKPEPSSPAETVPKIDKGEETEEVKNVSNNNADDNEEGSGSARSEAWNSSVGSGEGAETGRQQDDSENTGAVVSSFDSQEASLVAQGLVHDVLDKVLRPQAETGENDTDTEDPELKNTSRFPELEKVDLNSEDWDHDFRARASAAQDNISLSSSEDDKDRKQHEGEMQAAEFEETADGRVQEDTQDQQQAFLRPQDIDRNNSAGLPCQSAVSDTEHAQGPVETAPPPPGAPSSHREPAAATQSAPPTQRHGPSQHTGDSREAAERLAALEESHDGSYLWLQQQVQWRAGSTALPLSRLSRETGRHEHRDSSPRGRAEREGRRAETREGKTGAGFSMSGSADTSGSVSSPGAIPNFKTLQDQQVSWLSMYRMLEEEHRGELRAQYAEHQRIISDMQRHLEGELLNQQSAIRQKLHTHREALRDQSPRAGTRESSRSTHSSWKTLTDTDASQHYSQHSSHHDHHEEGSQQYGGRLPSHFESSTSCSQDRSRDSQLSRTEGSGEKRLRGGVYSSPMPLGKTRLSKREASDEEAESRHREGESGRARWSQNSLPLQGDFTANSSESPLHDQVLSPRTRLDLREKHAKHMADLRAYYEAEVQDLRHKLNSLTGGPLASASAVPGGRETARERILQQENQGLRQQLRELHDALDDAHIHNRELEQKLHGLEIRAADYADRYEESQQNVLKLKNRLEELHSYAKDRESMLEQVQSSERRQAAALQEMYKAQEEQAEAARRDKAALKRLLDKYEMLERDYNALKETSTDFEKKLFETRTEAVELNKVISQLELENKRLSHENDNMRHRLAISGSLPLRHQDVCETTHKRERLGDRLASSTGSISTRRAAVNDTDTRSPIRQDRTPPRRVVSDEEDSEVDNKADSPLLRAERELRRLQQTMGRGEFVPRLQPKKYSSTNSLGPVNGDVVIIDALNSPVKSASTSTACNGSRPKESKQKEKKIVNAAATRERNTGGLSKQPATNRAGSVAKSDNFQHAGLSSPTRFDVGVQRTGSRSPAPQSAVRKEREAGREEAADRREPSPSAKSPAAKSGGESSQIVDSTLKRIQSGDIVSRPQWEDVYTSLAKPGQPDNKTSPLNMTQEEILRDRIRSIDQLERRYDNLQVEKRKLESQLNKVPSHGRDRKTRREKELLEQKLDSVDHELGSLRMTLKRYQVLKTTF